MSVNFLQECKGSIESANVTIQLTTDLHKLCVEKCSRTRSTLRFFALILDKSAAIWTVTSQCWIATHAALWKPNEWITN